MQHQTNSILAICAWLFLSQAPAAAGDLHRAAGAGDIGAIEALLASGADVNATDGEGETALHKAAKANQPDAVVRLLQAGADPLVSAMGPFGATGTPIHVAAKFGRVDSLAALIDAGVDPNLLDPGVGTPLHLALRARRAEAVDLLREAGAGSRSAPPVTGLIAEANPEDGREISNTCQLCHLLEKAQEDRPMPGPPLWNIVGRPKASIEGQTYSAPMAALGGVWSFEDLNSLIRDARAYVPGTNMDGVAGISSASRRAALLRYLRDLSDSPVPLPD